MNEEQATVQDVLTAQDIDELPVNGRNFLDLAALEPGVQIQDGSTFDPTKNGYSSLSFGGRFGRTARIEVDGLDISDETVGTTTQNIRAELDSRIPSGEFEVRSFDRIDFFRNRQRGDQVRNQPLHGGGTTTAAAIRLSARIAPEDLAFGRKQFGARPRRPDHQEQAVLLRRLGADRSVTANPVQPEWCSFFAVRHLRRAVHTTRDIWDVWTTTSSAGWTAFFGSATPEPAASRLQPWRLSAVRERGPHTGLRGWHGLHIRKFTHSDSLRLPEIPQRDSFRTPVHFQSSRRESP